MDCHFLDLPIICHRASKLWKSGKSREWHSIRNVSWNKIFSTKFDDLGVIIIGNRCSIYQGEKNNCWLEQSPEKSTASTVPLFLGHPVYTKHKIDE